MSLNLTKFDGVTRFFERNSIVKSVFSSKIYKITILPFFRKIEFFFRFYRLLDGCGLYVVNIIIHDLLMWHVVPIMHVT